MYMAISFFVHFPKGTQPTVWQKTDVIDIATMQWKNESQINVQTHYLFDMVTVHRLG